MVEDVHWADPSTLDLLSYLARNSHEAGIVLVATFRTDELHRRHPLLPYLAELERGRATQRIDLARFDRMELSAQIGAIRDRQADTDLLEAIYSRSDGNPFFVEELLAVETAGNALPTVLRDVMLARLAALSEPTQEVLRKASASGPRVSTRLLARVAERDEVELASNLREAVELHILVAVETERRRRSSSATRSSRRPSTASSCRASERASTGGSRTPSRAPTMRSPTKTRRSLPTTGTHRMTCRGRSKHRCGREQRRNACTPSRMRMPSSNGRWSSGIVCRTLHDGPGSTGSHRTSISSSAALPQMPHDEFDR